MRPGTDPVLYEVVRAAVSATAAARGWMVTRFEDGLRVVAAVGEGAAGLVGVTTPADAGAAGYVVASAQPLALVPRPGDERVGTGVEALLDEPPASILCVPCAVEDEALGALQVVDKAGGAQFSFDDVELVTLLAGIGGAAIEASDATSSVPDPTELAGELARLAAGDPVRYARVANAVAGLVANG